MRRLVGAFAGRTYHHAMANLFYRIYDYLMLICDDTELFKWAKIHFVYLHVATPEYRAILLVYVYLNLQEAAFAVHTNVFVDNSLLMFLCIKSWLSPVFL